MKREQQQDDAKRRNSWDFFNFENTLNDVDIEADRRGQEDIRNQTYKRENSGGRLGLHENQEHHHTGSPFFNMLPSQTNARRGQHQPQNYRQTSSKTNIVRQNQSNDKISSK
jgi:hypothetical protein